MMVRGLYRSLVWLHPVAFRLQFGEEMLWIFDESRGAWDQISLARQWLIRSDLWIWVAAAIAGIVPLIVSFGSFLPLDKPMCP